MPRAKPVAKDAPKELPTLSKKDKQCFQEMLDGPSLLGFSPQELAILFLRGLGHKSGADLAHLSGMPVSRVYNLRHSIRKKLMAIAAEHQALKASLIDFKLKSNDTAL